MVDAIPVYDFHAGTAPLLISIPHAGTEVPPAIRERFTEAARELPDTDWHVHQLYDFARHMGASILKANYSRYVVDLNRAPNSQSLYAGNAASPVCATTTFSGAAIYSSGRELQADEIRRRVSDYWEPYHRRLADELVRITAQHGRALLWDAHSMASEIPALFDGMLPAFNFGTRDHASCPEPIARSLLQMVQAEDVFSAVLNGRFKGGYITLHHGRPGNGVYAVQLELAQRTYMDEPRGQWDRERASAAARHVERLLRHFLSLAAFAS